MRKWIIAIFGLIIVAFLITLLSGYSLVLPISEENQLEKKECNSGLINPLESFDFSKGDWEMFIVIDFYDMKDMPSDIREVNCFKTSDKSILNSLKEKWNFQCKGGDMATVSSSLYLRLNGKIVFSSGLMINSAQEGLQSKSFGWIFSKNKMISKELGNFNRVYSPLVFL